MKNKSFLELYESTMTTAAPINEDATPSDRDVVLKYLNDDPEIELHIISDDTGIGIDFVMDVYDGWSKEEVVQTEITESDSGAFTIEVGVTHAQLAYDIMMDMFRDEAVQIGTNEWSFETQEQLNMFKAELEAEGIPGDEIETAEVLDEDCTEETLTEESVYYVNALLSEVGDQIFHRISLESGDAQIDNMVTIEDFSFSAEKKEFVSVQHMPGLGHYTDEEYEAEFGFIEDALGEYGINLVEFDKDLAVTVDDRDVVKLHFNVQNDVYTSDAILEYVKNGLKENEFDEDGEFLYEEQVDDVTKGYEEVFTEEVELLVKDDQAAQQDFPLLGDDAVHAGLLKFDKAEDSEGASLVAQINTAYGEDLDGGEGQYIVVNMIDFADATDKSVEEVHFGTLYSASYLPTREEAKELFNQVVSTYRLGKCTFEDITSKFQNSEIGDDQPIDDKDWSYLAKGRLS